MPAPRLRLQWLSRRHPPAQLRPRHPCPASRCAAATFGFTRLALSLDLRLGMLGADCDLSLCVWCCQSPEQAMAEAIAHVSQTNAVLSSPAPANQKARPSLSLLLVHESLRRLTAVPRCVRSLAPRPRAKLSPRARRHRPSRQPLPPQASQHPAPSFRPQSSRSQALPRRARPSRLRGRQPRP